MKYTGIIILILICRNHSQSTIQSCPPEGRTIANASDCLTGDSSPRNVCCMITTPGFNPVNRTCIRIDLYYGQTKYYDSLNNPWDLSCAVEPEIKTGGQCGNPYSFTGADCWRFSNDERSCCFYYSQNTTGIPDCQWYKEKASGNKTTDEGLMLFCNSTAINVNLVIMSILALIL